MKIILGSKSPRRKELFAMLGYDFTVVVSDVDEDSKNPNPKEQVLENARKKGIAIKKLHRDSVIICADTIVVCNNKVIGKPKDRNDARAIISLLQDNYHYVYTGVVCLYNDERKEFVEGTKVLVTKMTNQEIEEYINTDEPYDKAGGYAVQGLFGKYIERIEGDFYNIVGLPICKLNKILKEIKKL